MFECMNETNSAKELGLIVGSSTSDTVSSAAMMDLKMSEYRDNFALGRYQVRWLFGSGSGPTMIFIVPGMDGTLSLRVSAER